MFPLLFIGQHFSQAIVFFVIIVHFSCFVIILQNFSCLLPSSLIILTCFLTYPPHTPNFERFLMSYIYESQIITVIRGKKLKETCGMRWRLTRGTFVNINVRLVWVLTNMWRDKRLWFYNYNVIK